MQIKNTDRGSWNPVLNEVVRVKRKYEQKYGPLTEKDYECPPGMRSCFENWIEKLDDPEITEKFYPLTFTQRGGLLLLRYRTYDLTPDGSSITRDEFWNKYDGFYKECRSLVVDLKKERLALVPFKKFKNMDESCDCTLEVVEEKIKNARYVEFSEKMDGSMQCARFYDGQVVMSGSQALDSARSWRLKDGYGMLNKNPGYTSMLKDNPDKTFIFEYISMQDAHVVLYKKEQEGLYLIGARDDDGYEYPYRYVLDTAEKYGILHTNIIHTDLNKVINSLDDKKSDEAEGFVLNVDGFRVKIKYNDYVKIHGILSESASVNVIIKSIADDRYDDMIARIPDTHRERIEEIAGVIQKYIAEKHKQAKKYYEMAPKTDRKTFMVWVDRNVPKSEVGYVKNLYTGCRNNYLKSGWAYKKMKDIDPDYKIPSNSLQPVRKEEPDYDYE